MKNTHSILVNIRFTFDGPVTHEELQKAIGRAVNTKQFRLVGQYTILDINDETMVEVPKAEVSQEADFHRTSSGA